jgi:tRNA dimethylallyltransferase
VICGPTGVGKTRFAIDLAKGFSGEIVGADSMQVYRHLDIGTAKPTAAERAMVPHHLVDCIDPDRPFDAANYEQRAYSILLALLEKGRVPFVVGGTGLYIKALIYGLSDAHPSNPAIRQRLRRIADREGAPFLHQRLVSEDPKAAVRIHPNDAFRIIRALEVLEITGRPISAHQDHHGFRHARFDALIIGLTLPRDQLYARINRRVDEMIAAGLQMEVQDLLVRGYDPRLKAMQSLGYRHMVAYLQKKISWENAILTLKRDHRRYAKRQLTWFEADPSIHWLDPQKTTSAVQLIDRFLTN